MTLLSPLLTASSDPQTSAVCPASALESKTAGHELLDVGQQRRDPGAVRPVREKAVRDACPSAAGWGC
jgi:hypothetical protein